MDDFPWHYAAMIFIVFVSWLYQRLQEISASRRLRSAERKAAADEQQRAERAPREAHAQAWRRPRHGQRRHVRRGGGGGGALGVR